MWSRESWLALIGAATLLCCSASGTDDDGDVARLDDDGAGGGFGGGFLAGGSNAGGGPTDDCSEAARLIYLLSENNTLHSFDPSTRQVVSIGALACDPNMSPNSMAVDRDAVAWVNYVGNSGAGDASGAVFKVSTVDATCEPAPTVTLPAGWYRVGMGFSTDGADTTDETLFVTSINSDGALGRIDRDTGQLTEIGAFTGTFTGQNAELTGTGDGRLYGFFTSSPVEVGILDKVTGEVESSTLLPTVEQPAAWAFSFWGGDFYLYTAPSGVSSRVNRYRPADGSVDTEFVPNIGFRIVGAGVSTCAPLAQPK